MQPLLERKLLFITGKGGVGKTTMAGAVALAGAGEGRRTIVVEVGAQSRLAELFGVRGAPHGAVTQLERGLSSITIDPDRALLEWLQALGGRIPGRVLASSGTFQYFAAAAPGAKELVTMVKIWQLTRGTRSARAHDLVVVDAPATGHALALLGSPRTFGAIARIGPIAGQTRQVQELLQDRSRTGYVAVALGTEMAVTETLELQEALRRDLGRELSAVIVNGLLPRRFSAAEIERITLLAGNGTSTGDPEELARATHASAPHELRAAAVRAAVEVHQRGRFQHNQVARLRRRSFDVIAVPFVWEDQLSLAAIRRVAERLAHAGRAGGKE